MMFKRTAILLFFYLVLGFNLAFSNGISCDTLNNNESQELLNAKLEKCQEEVALQQTLIKEKEKETASLQRDLNLISAKVKKVQSEIKAREIAVLNLDREVDKKNQTINELVERMDRIKSSTSELMRKTRELEFSSLPEIILGNYNVSDFFMDLGYFESIEASFRTTINQIKDLRKNEEAEKLLLREKMQEERHLKYIQEIEKRKLEVMQAEKNRIVRDSQGEEKKYKEILSEKQTLIAKIRNIMLKITDGGELKFAEALRIVRVGESATGVRAAFVLSVLTQESGSNGNIGANLGRCYYNTPWKNGSGTVMSNSQKASFLALLSSLKPPLDPNKTPVSCPISRDGAYGGAMGPSQFMPTSWWDIKNGTGYKKRIERITGNVPASPFNNLDAFTATALYLSDALEKCEKVYSSKYNQEACAAARYYAGNNWNKHFSGYGKRVANRAIEFQKDIDVLDSE